MAVSVLRVHPEPKIRTWTFWPMLFWILPPFARSAASTVRVFWWFTKLPVTQKVVPSSSILIGVFLSVAWNQVMKGYSWGSCTISRSGRSAIRRANAPASTGAFVTIRSSESGSVIRSTWNTRSTSC